MSTIARPTTRRSTSQRPRAQQGHSEAPSTAREVAQRLRSGVGLTEADLATATGASTRTVRRWLADDAGGPQARYAARIDDLRIIVDELQDSLTSKGIRQWLHARSRYLQGARPIDSIGKGQFDSVHKAALAFSEGYYI